MSLPCKTGSNSQDWVSSHAALGSADTESSGVQHVQWYAFKFCPGDSCVLIPPECMQATAQSNLCVVLCGCLPKQSRPALVHTVMSYLFHGIHMLLKLCSETRKGAEYCLSCRAAESGIRCHASRLHYISGDRVWRNPTNQCSRYLARIPSGAYHLACIAQCQDIG